jgi:hypothetical protein
MITIYGKTALGMGLQSKYIEFFDSMARFRVSGYKSFIWTVITYEIGWVLGLVLNYDGDEDGRVRWLIALPAADRVGGVGAFE